MEFNQLKKEYNKIFKATKKIENLNFSNLIGLKVKISKSYSKWIKENGDELGIPFKEMQNLINRPKGIIEKVEFCKDDGLTFKIKFKNKKHSFVGINDIDLAKEK